MLATSAVSAGIELPDCKFDSGTVGSTFKGKFRAAHDASNLLEVKGDLKGGEEISYTKNSPVIVADLISKKIIPVFSPTSDFTLNSSSFMSPTFKFKTGKNINMPFEALSADGSVYRVVRLEGRDLFLDSNNVFCNKVIFDDSRGQTWSLGTLTQDQPSIFDINLTEFLVQTQSMRIIFTGVGMGQISFQQLLVNGSTIVETKTRNFDQFSKQIRIAPFTFDIIGIEGDAIKLRYAIPDRL